MNFKEFDLVNIQNKDKIHIIYSGNNNQKVNIINSIINYKQIDNGLCISIDTKLYNNNIQHKYSSCVINHKLSTNDEYLILDSCFYDRNWLRDKSIENTFTKLDLLVILSSKYPLYLTKTIYSSLNCIFILKNINREDLKLIYCYYAIRIFSSYVDFEDIINEIFNDDKIMVIYNNCIYKYNINQSLEM